MGNTSQQPSHYCPPAALADGRRDEEFGPQTVVAGPGEAWQRPAGMLPLTPGLPLANPLLPRTQTILSLSLSSAVGVPVQIPHPTVLIID